MDLSTIFKIYIH